MLSFFSLVALNPARPANTNNKTAQAADPIRRPEVRLLPAKSAPLATRALMAALAIGLFQVAAPALEAAPASPAAAQSFSLPGDWRVDGGVAVARVAACAHDSRLMCATVISEVLEPGEESVKGKVVLRNIRLTKPGQYAGEYRLEENRFLPATLKVHNPGLLELKVCMGVFCDRLRLERM